ncbi:MAG: methionyl-tRNA formyltransferase, partial [Candidatus Kerfeldbacteria bacterium CG08_land_8_20_14_0_20_42_7]
MAVPLFCALERHQEISIKFAVTQPDKKANKNILTESSIKQEAKSLGIPVLQPTSLSDKNFYQTFLDADISLCVLFAYGSIIPALLLDAPPLGWVNVHPSLLPAYRGAS